MECLEIEVFKYLIKKIQLPELLLLIYCQQ